jgi:hypothetical protein
MPVKVWITVLWSRPSTRSTFRTETLCTGLP